MKSPCKLPPRIVAMGLALAVALACDAGSEKGHSGRSHLDELLLEITGSIIEPTLRADWDDGSGGDPEKVVVYHGEYVHYLARSVSSGWHSVASAWVRQQELKTDPFWLMISGSGHGCLLGYELLEGGVSVTPYRLLEDGIETGGFPETDPDAIAKIKAAMTQALGKDENLTRKQAAAAAERIVGLLLEEGQGAGD